MQRARSLAYPRNVQHALVISPFDDTLSTGLRWCIEQSALVSNVRTFAIFHWLVCVWRRHAICDCEYRNTSGCGMALLQHNLHPVISMRFAHCRPLEQFVICQHVRRDRGEYGDGMFFRSWCRLSPRAVAWRAVDGKKQDACKIESEDNEQ